MENSQTYADLARQGDTEAFSKLYEGYYKDLYCFALYLLRNRHDAEDAVSDAVADAYARIGSLRKAESFGPWIFRILTAKCKRRLKEYTLKTGSLPETLSTQGRDICEDMDVREAFFRLEDADRLILSLHLFAGYTSREIARELKMSPGTVRSRQCRALKKMQELLSL